MVNLIIVSGRKFIKSRSIFVVVEANSRVWKVSGSKFQILSLLFFGIIPYNRTTEGLFFSGGNTGPVAGFGRGITKRGG